MGNSPNGKSTIDAVTGIVSVATGAVIDFAHDGGSYTLVVGASDGTTVSAATFTVEIGHPMATAFLAIGSGATTAPLNPAYKVDEFDFYLKDLSAKALIVDAQGHAAAEQAAKQLGVPVLRLLTEEFGVVPMPRRSHDHFTAPAISREDYETGLPSAEAACPVGDARVLSVRPRG